MNKAIGLVGCGNLGYPLAFYLGQLGFSVLYLHDLDKGKVAKLKRALERFNPALRVVGYLEKNKIDIILLSLGGPETVKFVTDARNYDFFNDRPVFISLGRPNYDNLTAHAALHKYLIERDVWLLFGFGVEPGLVEILMHDLASRYDSGTVASLSAVCGGVPQYPNPPLNYDLLFGERLPAINRKVLKKIDSRLEHCLRFDIKETHFVEGVGLLDVYHDGLSPYFLRSECIDAIPTVKQQTARWPGFYDCVRSLNSLGLLDEQVLPGAHASPSDLVHEILLRNGRLARGRPDISFVEVNMEFATGERAALRILSRFDEQSGLTGMAQLTSFLAAWTTLRISDSAILHQQGLTLSHEFYGRDTTRELLGAYKRYVKCSVSALP